MAYSCAMIEKVGYSKPVNATRNVRRTGSTDGVAFANALSAAEGADGVSAANAVGSIAALGGATGLIGIQEVNDEEMHRRKAVKRGRLTLEALEKLRDGLLLGELPLSTLRSLEKLVEQERASTHDPSLTAILDDIELRAAVELAKLEVAGLIPQQA